MVLLLGRRFQWHDLNIVLEEAGIRRRVAEAKGYDDGEMANAQTVINGDCGLSEEERH